jgi:gliding motility associated protien GldN
LRVKPVESDSAGLLIDHLFRKMFLTGDFPPGCCLCFQKTGRNACTIQARIINERSIPMNKQPTPRKSAARNSFSTARAILFFALTCVSTLAFAQTPARQTGTVPAGGSPQAAGTPSTGGATVTTTAAAPAGGGAVLSPGPAFGETFYLKERARTRKATPYTPERESDIMWSKRVWRTIDLREKFNHPIYFPETQINDRKSLFDVIKAGMLSGEIYGFGDPVMNDEFQMRMTRAEIANTFTWWDSTAVTEDPNNPGTFISAPIEYSLTSKDVKQYWVKEDWFFDKQRSVMDVRILGLCPLQEKLDPVTNEFLGWKPLFWVYFPQCRELFARSEVFNTKNDAQRLTYDDLFQKRMFQSFVRKESNVFDRPINAYAVDIDAMLEADRVKDEIFKVEHDLWHF